MRQPRRRIVPTLGGFKNHKDAKRKIFDLRTGAAVSNCESTGFIIIHVATGLADKPVLGFVGPINLKETFMKKSFGSCLLLVDTNEAVRLHQNIRAVAWARRLKLV